VATAPGRYSLGPGHSLTIVRNDNGATVTLDGQRSKFESKEEDELVKSSPIDNGGRVTGLRVPAGISGSIDVEKGSDDFNQLMMFLDSNYYNNNQQQIYFTMTETYLNPIDGTTSSNQFQEVQFHGYSRGTWERASIVKTMVSFFATEVVPV
jgi:hypothetical protein